jgi:hypothetical protein
MSDRIRELESIAEECERAADEQDGTDGRVRHALYVSAGHFRSRARILAKVRGKK